MGASVLVVVRQFFSRWGLTSGHKKNCTALSCTKIIRCKCMGASVWVQVYGCKRMGCKRIGCKCMGASVWVQAYGVQAYRVQVHGCKRMAGAGDADEQNATEGPKKK